MDLAALGLTVRALRRRRGWRQVDLARAAGVSQAVISEIERGHGERLPVRTLAAVAGGVDGRLVVQIRWRGGDLDRLMDSDHAAIVAGMAAILTDAAWLVRVEVTYAAYRATGSIDILAWHPPSRTLLVIEVKTEITSAEATLRKLDEKVRIGPAVARDRFGWAPVVVARLLVVEDASTARRRIDAHAALFDAVLPAVGHEVRRWIARPGGPLAGRYFLSGNARGSGIRALGGRHRVRARASASKRSVSSVAVAAPQALKEQDAVVPTILVG